MTAIWQNDGTGWHLLVPTGFPNEATLHDLVEQAPHLLPLASNPRLIVVGREVQLGSGFADLIAVEPDGRMAVIEIKLARNKEPPLYNSGAVCLSVEHPTHWLTLKHLSCLSNKEIRFEKSAMNFWKHSPRHIGRQ